MPTNEKKEDQQPSASAPPADQVPEAPQEASAVPPSADEPDKRRHVPDVFVAQRRPK